MKETLGSISRGLRSSEVPHNQRQGVNIRPNDNINHLEENDSDDEIPLAACILIISDDGKVLAVSRKDDPSDFGLPGGKVDPGEDAKTAAIRELKEETGLDVRDVREIFDDVDDTHHVTTFFAEAHGTIDTDESGVIRWVDIAVLTNPNTSRFYSYNRKLFKAIGIT